MALIDEPSPFEDEIEQPQILTPSARVAPDHLWNLGTLVVLLCMVILVAVIALIYLNPQAVVNPYPPPTLPVAMLLPTATETPLPPTAEPTDRPTATPAPTETPLPAAPTATLVSVVQVDSPTPHANAAYAYDLRSAPAPIDATLLYPGRGCTWMGVGGQVENLSGRPMTGINVQMYGIVDGRSMNVITLTGTAQKYGEAGYEFTISDEKVFASKGVFWIQLIDQQRNPLSRRVVFDTFDDCARNLVVINFTQVR
jgi:hypothetical protein